MFSSAITPDARNMLSDLRQELLAVLPLPTAFVSYTTLLLIDQIYGLRHLAVPIIVFWTIATSLIAQRLRGKRPWAAAAVYLTGPIGSAAAAIWLSLSPLAMALFPALILLSMAVSGFWAMAITAVLGEGVILTASWHYGQLDRYILIPVAVLAFSAAVAWLSHRSLLTALDWAWNSYQQARNSTEKARQHRAELARTLKALDEAYYRLERFSAQLGQAREAAEDARRAKQQFVATVSHELRTPLNIIIGFAELMALSPESYGVHGVPRRFMGDVNRIYRSAQHLKGLIDDVLDLSQVDARRMVLLAEPSSLDEIIREATDMVWSLATQKGLELIVDIPASLPPLPLDRLRIRQVLLNLLANAVRFTDAGHVSISARLLEEQVQVTVADTGPGIAPEDLGRVFEEFHQLDGTLSRHHEGTGLGLALSRRFVGLHGGHMWVESELGEGSQFHFTLPLVAPATQGMLGTARSLPMPPGVQAQAGRTVLVDALEPMVANLLRRHLRGYRVRCVAPDELQEAAVTQFPHAVIRNSLLPSASEDGDGSCPTGASLHVRVITCPLPDLAYLGHRLGVDHYLVKPITRERLLELVETYGDTVRRVLIVDDDVQLAELVARLIQASPRGYEVEAACGGEEGWARIQAWQPDLVLLDLVMPGLDGLGVLRLVRADERLRDMHVIVVTAHDLLDDSAPLPVSSIRLEEPESLTVSEALNCLQALLDALPPPSPGASPPPRPAAGQPDLRAS